jgi:trigger factor
MKSEVTHLSDTRKKLTIEVEPEEVDAAYKNTLKEAAKQVRIPGFRPGKAPRELIKARLGNDLHGQVGEKLVEDYARQAIREAELSPVSGSIRLNQPEHEHHHHHEHGHDEGGDHNHDHDHDHGHDHDHDHGPAPASEGEPYRFEVEVDVMPTVDPQNYTGRKIARPKVEVEEDEEREELDKLREQMARLVTVEDRRSQLGDFVEVEIGGQQLDGEMTLDTRTQMVPLGGEGTIEDFNQALTDKAVGDEFSVDVTYGDEHQSEELRGKTMRFSGKVTAIKQKELPPLDDSLAKQLADLESLDELRQKIRESIEARKNNEADEVVRQRIVDQLLDEHPIEAPESLVEQEHRERLEAIGQHMYRSGVDPQNSGIDMDKLVRETRQEADKAVRRDLLLDAIAAKEGLQVNPKEVDQAVQRIAQEWGKQTAETKQQLQQSGGLTALRRNILRRKCLDWLQERAEIC